MVAGVEVRVDVDPEGQVIAATLSYGGSEAQVGAFAAPRTAGIWDEIRAEIRGSITGQGGTAQEGKGRFGTELVGRVPVQGGYQSVRFVGVDGPRWFLRALFTGPAATDPARAGGAGGRGPQHRGGPRHLADAGARPAAADAARRSPSRPSRATARTPAAADEDRRADDVDRRRRGGRRRRPRPTVGRRRADRRRR